MHSKSNASWTDAIAQGPAFIDDATVARLLSAADALSVIERAFVDAPITPPRLAVDSGDERQTRTLLVMPAMAPGGIATVKVVTALRGEAGGLSSHLMAFDQAGTLLAVIEAHQLTARRTAAASVLAARALGAGGARRIAVLGAGRQAYAQIEAYAAALDLESITIWARRKPPAEELAARCRTMARTIRVASSPDEAVRDAEIVTCATASEAPLILGESLQQGTHVDLVGGYQPDMREADDGVMRRATIVADARVALAEAGDLVQPIGSGAIAREDVIMLADILTGKRTLPKRDITVFKSVGHAAEDLVVAELLLQRLGLASADDALCFQEGSASS
jgi:ornithine cyclodeaminase